MAPLLRKASDDKAFERLYERHVKDVFRYALAVLGERADAEDVTQTTFLNAYRAFQRGERPAKPEHWLIAIAHNVCRQRFRQQQRRPFEVEFEDELGGAVEPDDDGPTLDELRRAFAALPPNQRAALVMRELEGRRYDEIAEVLGISVSALETLLFRARRALREQLEEQLSCRDAAFAISKGMDGRLSAGERRALRAHLRACPECSRLASSQRAQRKALRTLLAVPLPTSLQTFWPHAAETAAGGAAAGGTALAVKAAAVVAAGTLVGGGAYEGVKQATPHVNRPKPVAVRRLPATTVAQAIAAPTHVDVPVAVPSTHHARRVAVPPEEHVRRAHRKHERAHAKWAHAEHAERVETRHVPPGLAKKAVAPPPAATPDRPAHAKTTKPHGPRRAGERKEKPKAHDAPGPAPAAAAAPPQRSAQEHGNGKGRGDGAAHGNGSGNGNAHGGGDR